MSKEAEYNILMDAQVMQYIRLNRLGEVSQSEREDIKEELEKLKRTDGKSITWQEQLESFIKERGVEGRASLTSEQLERLGDVSAEDVYKLLKDINGE